MYTVIFEDDAGQKRRKREREEEEKGEKLTTPNFVRDDPPPVQSLVLDLTPLYRHRRT